MGVKFELPERHVRCQVDHWRLDLELKLKDVETGAAEPHT